MENNHHKMYIKAIFVLIVSITNIKCAPVVENDGSMLDAILLKCPILSKNEKFKTQNEDLWKKCNDWTKNIEVIEKVSKENEDKVACLLYYDSITKVCTGLSHNIQQNNAILLPDLSAINFSCDKFTQILQQKTFEHGLKSMISNSRICEKLCYYYNDTVKYSCAMAYYFTNLHVEPVKLPQKADSSLLPIASENLDPQLEGPHNADPKKITTNLRLDKSNNAEEVHNNVKSKAKVSNTDSVGVFTNIHASNAEQEQVTTVNEIPETTIANKNIHHENPNQENQPSDHHKLKTAGGKPVATVENYEAKDEGEPYMSQETGDTTDASPAESGNNPTVHTDASAATSGKNPTGVYVTTGDGTKGKKPSTVDDEPANYNTTDDLSGDSYFLSYFTVTVCLFFVGYVGYHNRQKILALLLEGKKGRKAQRGRRPNSANYHKLDCNLEEALTSSCNKNNSHIIY